MYIMVCRVIRSSLETSNLLGKKNPQGCSGFRSCFECFVFNQTSVLLPPRGIRIWIILNKTCLLIFYLFNFRVYRNICHIKVQKFTCFFPKTCLSTMTASTAAGSSNVINPNPRGCPESRCFIITESTMFPYF